MAGYIQRLDCNNRITFGQSFLLGENPLKFSIILPIEKLYGLHWDKLIWKSVGEYISCSYVKLYDVKNHNYGRFKELTFIEADNFEVMKYYRNLHRHEIRRSI